MNETPMLRQLLICEKVIFEQGSGNVSLINCHSVRIVDRLPAAPVQFVVYGVLTDGFGTFTMQVRIVNLAANSVMFRRSFPMLLNDRLRETNVVCRINDLIFLQEGRYEVDLLANNELIGMTTLTLKKR